MRRRALRRVSNAWGAAEVGGGVWRIRHSWGNAWALTDGNEVSLIDTGTIWDRKEVAEGLRAACGGKLPRLRHVILTHGHTDHAGGAALLAAQFDAPIVCHRNEAVFVETRRTYVPRGLRALSPSGALFALGEVAFPVRRAPVGIRVLDGDRIETPAGPLRVVATPGHTPGHAAYLLEPRGWLFSGDALIDIIPWRMVVGLSLPPDVFTSDRRAMLTSALAVVDLRPEGLLSGHGPAILERTSERLADFAAHTIEPRRIRLGAR